MITNESDGVQSDQTTLRESAQSDPPPSAPSPTSTSEIPWYKKLWQKLRITPRDMRNTFKMSLPSIICIALFQSDFIANYFTTNGYINALIALTVLPTLPRARFIDVLAHCIFSICLAAALVILALWCGIQARIHTTNPALPPEKYNSSQSAILGIWLFCLIWSGSTVKSAYPLTMMPVLLFEIYVVVGCTSGVFLQTVPAALIFSNILLVNFLFGLSIATGVSLFTFPVTCRKVFFEAVTGYLETIRKALKTQQAYLHFIQAQDPWHSDIQSLANDDLIAHRKVLDGMYGAAAKMRGELEFAAKEAAFANLDADQMSKLSEWALRIMPAFSGLGFVYDIIYHLYDDAERSAGTIDGKKVAKDWQTIMQALDTPISDLSTAMDLAIEHVLLTLRLKKRVEGGSNANPVPGSPGFLAWYGEQTMKFTQTRELVARLWFEQEGVKLPEDFLQYGFKLDEKFKIDTTLFAAHRKPFTVIYIQFLLYAASREIFDLVTLVDSLNADGTLSKRRFIGPSFKHLQKWYHLFFQGKESDSRLSPQASTTSYNSSGTHPMPDPRKTIKNDPEHLPATSWWEIIGNHIRLFPKLMRSSHSSHGLRVACAIISVAIGFYIKTSSKWFSANRWLWAMFAIVLTMNRTAGLSLFLFFCRLGGTAVAMVASFAIYYMVDGKTAGVIVMMWVWFLFLAYLMFRLPFYMPALVVTLMATIVMIGNELQDKKLGFARVTSLGQAAHEEYLMAPERLAIVAAGIGIGFFWTIFPYPLSEHTELRQDLATALHYLASHHSMIAQTVSSRARGLHTSMAHRNDNNLARERMKMFTKVQFLFGRLRQHLKFIKYQVSLGGKFPTAQYTELVGLCEKIFTASNVIGYASTSFVRAWEDTHTLTPSGNKPYPESHWIQEFRSLLGTVDLVSDEVISTLIRLSNHMSSATPFPPLVKSPEVGKLARVIDEIRGNIMTVTHITEPGYAAFVTMTIAGRGINSALTRQLEICKELVGILDFSSLVDVDMEMGGSRLDEEQRAEQMGSTGFTSAYLG